MTRVRHKLYQVDAFSGRLFAGNPAAVVPLERWLPDDTLQALAMENNLSETAFFLPRDGRYQLRWFTPVTEVKLCGHATLATAFVLYEVLGEKAPVLRFDTLSGELTVTHSDGMLWMDFPAFPPRPCAAPPALAAALGRAPREVLAANYYVALFEDPEEVRALAPDFAALKKLELHGVMVTAHGTDCDFVSRFFAPWHGIDEDPATGSAHCTLAPLWAERLDRAGRLHARQLSKRGGELWCESAGERVRLGGRARLYLEGEFVTE